MPYKFWKIADLSSTAARLAPCVRTVILSSAGELNVCESARSGHKGHARNHTGELMIEASYATLQYTRQSELPSEVRVRMLHLSQEKIASEREIGGFRIAISCVRIGIG